MDAKSNEVLVLLSDLSAGAEYRVFLEHPQAGSPDVSFVSMLGGIKKGSDGVFSLMFENGVEIRTSNGMCVKFFRKIW